MTLHTGKAALPLPSWAASLTLYEVNIRQYTTEGTFEAFARHLPRLRDMGVGILWLMPVFPISKTRRKGSLGSYYSVSDYRAVHPDLGSMEDFKQLIESIHDLGMYVILDWVPNHTGWDHPWVSANPEFYQKDNNGHTSEPLDAHGKPLGWEDVAGLDYSNSELRKTMIEEMAFWVKEAGIDGFRQDMALLVPTDFWEEAATSLLGIRPDLLLLAESENYELLQRPCFHIIYGWTLHHMMTKIARGTDTARDLDYWLSIQKPMAGPGLFLHFTSNHDENSWSGSEIERLGEAYRAFAVLAMTLDGMPLIYSGQEEPLTRRLAFFEKDNIGFSAYRESEFYTKLLHLRRRNQALWNGAEGGELGLLEADEQLLLYQRQAGQHKVTIGINLSRRFKKYILKQEITGRELFTQSQVLLAEGQTLLLSPWQYFVVEHVEIQTE